MAGETKIEIERVKETKTESARPTAATSAQVAASAISTKSVAPPAPAKAATLPAAAKAATPEAPAQTASSITASPIAAQPSSGGGKAVSSSYSAQSSGARVKVEQVQGPVYPVDRKHEFPAEPPKRVESKNKDDLKVCTH